MAAGASVSAAGSPADQPLWRPSRADRERAALTRFWRLAQRRTGRAFSDYAALHAWSVTDTAAFWGLYAEFAGIRFERPAESVKGPERMPGTDWFPGSRLNYAANLLRRRDAHPALLARTEAGVTRQVSYAELHTLVARCAHALRGLGVRPGDRIAGYLTNTPETVIAFLASAAIGAVWTACSPDFGAPAAIDRFGQVAPKVLFVSERYRYGGRSYDCLASSRALSAALPTLERTVLVPYEPDRSAPGKSGWMSWSELLQNGSETAVPFASLPFDHPLYILYSSGTTGAPKCMVHGAGGVLLQHRKEHQLHTDLRADDVIVYFTTCGWMMWNWLVSGLAGGHTLALYDGSPAYPSVSAAWRIAAELGVTVFGTSAAFIEACMRARVDLRDSTRDRPPRIVLSTGSPLSPTGFRWISGQLGERVRLSSISGGTDIVSCFVLGNPLLPVYAGEIQCIGLGMDVAAYDEDGRPVTGRKGELVCRRPFPSMPVRFWNDPDGRKYRDAYFGEYPGVWRHGDLIELTGRGGVIIHGRSDATLKPGGVRVGTAEIYRPLDALPWIDGCLATAFSVGRDERIALFVTLRSGTRLSEQHENEIRRVLRRDASPRHVPRWIYEVADLPRTRNGKLAELAVAHALRGEAVPNLDSLANPACLGAFAEIGLSLRAAAGPTP